MAEKISPAQKSVPRADGFKPGGDHTCFTTPTDNEGNVWMQAGEQTLSVFSSSVGNGKGPNKSSPQ
jgi:hypothetical protein